MRYAVLLERSQISKALVGLIKALAWVYCQERWEVKEDDINAKQNKMQAPTSPNYRNFPLCLRQSPLLCDIHVSARRGSPHDRRCCIFVGGWRASNHQHSPKLQVVRPRRQGRDDLPAHWRCTTQASQGTRDFQQKGEGPAGGAPEIETKIGARLTSCIFPPTAERTATLLHVRAAVQRKLPKSRA